MTNETRAPSTNFRGPAILGLSLIAFLFGGSLAWAYFAEVSGAVIAQGTVDIQGKPKTIQHADGGIVKAIHISAGEVVRKDDVLIELDSTTIAANLAIYRGRLRDALVRRARLLAELDSRIDFAPPREIDIQRFQLTDIEPAMEQQRILMRVRRQTRDGEISQFDEKIAQLRNQIEGADGLRREKRRQIEVYEQEQASLQRLVEQEAIPRNQLLGIERATAELRGQIAEQGGEIARLENSISEAEIARAQVDKQMREKNTLELEEVEAKIDEMQQQILATDLQLQRTTIRSPIDGIIHELAMHTIGGVVQQGQAIMQIIPTDGDLEIEVNADTRSVDEITLDRRAIVRFPAFHERTTPEIFGRVVQVSPSSVVEERTGAAFYRVRISVPAAEKAKLGKRRLIPGMPVEAVMPTADRTVLSYLLKPLADQIAHAMREQ
ncbi:HlyD family secretion protein (plasmid) [Ensifer sp. WSM1721]|nr:HlyD family type I secretion periplasmic adaptor subunit [Ensifer sp. WSM1721]